MSKSGQSRWKERRRRHQVSAQPSPCIACQLHTGVCGPVCSRGTSVEAAGQGTVAISGSEGGPLSSRKHACSPVWRAVLDTVFLWEFALVSEVPALSSTGA